MDPISALGIAAAVVQFVDFGSRLLHGVVEIHKSESGQLTEHAQLAQMSSDLLRLTLEVEDKARFFGTTTNYTRSDSEEIFFRLCQECAAISRELGAALARVQDNRSGIGRRSKVSSVGGVFQDFKTALRAIWGSKDAIQFLPRRLADVRQEIMTAVLLLLWGENQQRGKRHDQIIGLLDNLAKSTQALKADRIVVDLGPTSITNELNEILGDLPTKQSQEGGVTALLERKGSGFESISEVQSQLEAKMRRGWKHSSVFEIIDLGLSSYSIPEPESRAVERFIIESLKYESMRSRVRSISRAHSKTFRWVFEEPPLDQDGQALWSSFSGWLERKDDREVYWITGKPGSGKSTLMSFILENCRQRLLNSLSNWAGEVPVFLASFYAWHTGNDLQRTVEGFLRTMLSEFLTKIPALLKALHPRRYMLRHDFHVLGVDAPLPDWELPELLQCFRALVSHSGTSFKLALFVDGLDEFDGDHTHQLLINLIKEISSHPAIKVCVSSRPWNVFNDAFKKEPSLRLENLTQKDIQGFVEHEFDANVGYQEMKDAFPDQANQLIIEIVDKGKGVFLWISIVVRTLLAELTEGSLFSELQAKVDNLPEDLSRLYESIWTRIQPEFRIEASKYIQLLEKSRSYNTFPALSLDILWLSHEDVPLDINLQAMSRESREAARKPIQRRLNSRTKNLLETRRSGGIDYLHRTAHEWVISQWKRIIEDGPQQFEPALWLFKGFCLSLSPRSKGLTALHNPKELLSFVECCRDIRDIHHPQFKHIMGIFSKNTIFKNGICWVCNEIWTPHKSCFLYFCAALCLNNYVSDLVRTSSSPEEMLQVISKAGSSSSFPCLVLRAALFGYTDLSAVFSQGVIPGPFRNCRDWFYDETKREMYGTSRVELVKFLLSTCTYSLDVIISLLAGVDYLLIQCRSDPPKQQSSPSLLYDSGKQSKRVRFSGLVEDAADDDDHYLEADDDPLASSETEKRFNLSEISPYLERVKRVLRDEIDSRQQQQRQQPPPPPPPNRKTNRRRHRRADDVRVIKWFLPKNFRILGKMIGSTG
ncbi:hypothetical protein QBC38DRAFT_496912 [Podospora fimiseda]|uniref:Nephrocystin 3-like N-terminal domain-containing protein n=1 Tax=Podospora fimiseda TaxID=252190 RepID=A0AAN7BV49_9PEZI|nr:hypothetical protein QBC38DRAFT_496912 [Podospora fimiseda]